MVAPNIGESVGTGPVCSRNELRCRKAALVTFGSKVDDRRAVLVSPSLPLEVPWRPLMLLFTWAAMGLESNKGQLT